jgi:hypothetical protein
VEQDMSAKPEIRSWQFPIYNIEADESPNRARVFRLVALDDRLDDITADVTDRGSSTRRIQLKSPHGASRNVLASNCFSN